MLEETRLKQGSFPLPISLGPRAVGWVETDIEEWIKNQIDSSHDVNK